VKSKIINRIRERQKIVLRKELTCLIDQIQKESQDAWAASLDRIEKQRKEWHQHQQLQHQLQK